MEELIVKYQEQLQKLVHVTEGAMLECNNGDLDKSTGYEVLESALKLSGQNHIAENVHKEALEKCLKSNKK
jgi:hypothetical protein